MGGLMLKNMSIYQIITSYLRQCWNIAAPGLALFVAYSCLHVLSSYLPQGWYIYSLLMLATIATLGGIYYYNWRYAYGTVVGGIFWYYVTYRLIYVAYVQLEPSHLALWLVLLNGLTFFAAIFFTGRLLACIGIVGVFLVPWIFSSLFITMQMLVTYCIATLAIIMLVSFLIDAVWLNILGFVGYLLYHETIFSVITIDPQYGVLTLNEVFFVMGLLFALYTVVPIATTTVYKEHFSQSLLMAIVGAYTFLVTEATVAYQLQRIHELPFFLKVWVKGIPSLANVHIQMSWIYAAAYGMCSILLLFMNRHAKMMLASLLTLFCLSLIGLLYIHNFPFWEIIAYLKKWIVETLLVAGAGFEPATFGL